MRGCITSLIQLAIVVVPMITFVLVWWFCEAVWHLLFPFPLIIAGVVTVALIGIPIGWLIWSGKRSEKVLSEISDSFFGQIRQKRNDWETRMDLPGFGSNIVVLGCEGNLPTAIQKGTVEWLIKSADTIKKEMDDCLDGFDSDLESLPPRPRKLVFESLLLDPEDPKTFSLSFDVEGADLPWGFTAFYTSGTIEEFTDDH